MNSPFREKKKFVKALKLLREHRKQFKKLFKQHEVAELVSLESSYKSVFKSRLPTEKKIDRLLDVLVRSSAYMERLTAIKNDLISYSTGSLKLVKQITRCLQRQEGFNKLTKKKQETLIEIELGEFVDFERMLKNSLDIINNSIDYLNKLQFNLKFVVGILKDRAKEGQQHA